MHQRRPNILFVLSDQHNPHWLGHAGHPWVRTPHLDALARAGLRFENCYCQNPLCVPSRAALVTGRYSRNQGIYDNQHILEANSITFPRVLSQAGYRTCLIGKAHFNGEQFHGYQQRPYGDWFGQAHQPDPRRTPDKGESGLGEWLQQPGPSGIPLPLTQTEICVAETAKWLQLHQGLHPQQPFLLSVHFDKPHFPFNPPPALFEHSLRHARLPRVRDPHFRTSVPFVRQAIRWLYPAEPGRLSNAEQEQRRRTLAAYAGCVEWVDDAVGRVLEVLDYLGLADDTLVIYSSDHGEMAGEHGLWQQSVFFAASARVPLLMRWPGRIAPAKRVAVPVGLIDLFPTLCAVAGVSAPATCDGQSLLPVLDGGRLHRDAIYSESVLLKQPEHAGCMIRSGPWKYNLYLDGAEELYHLPDDPHEECNLAGKSQHAARVGTLRRQVERFWEPQAQLARYQRTPRMAREKHFYFYSNQFLTGEGIVVDAQP